MKIISIQTQVKYIALKTPFITALREVKDIEFVRIKVLCESGEVSFGEAPATKAITGEDIKIILNSIKSSKEDLLSKTPKEALVILHDKLSIGSSAKAALDMAFISLLAQEKKQVLYQYFGGEVRELYTDVTISLNTKEKMLKDSKEAVKNNMPILKVKLGKDINHAIDVTQTLSKELSEAKLLIDANQAWSLESTLYYIESIKDLKVELIEQPVKADELESLKLISEKSSIPIMADESAFNLVQVKALVESASADMINIKLMKCGGLSKAQEILQYAREKNIKCMLGSMLEGPISINAALHLSLAYADVIKYVDLDSPLLYKEPSSELDFEFNGCEIRLKNQNFVS